MNDRANLIYSQGFALSDESYYTEHPQARGVYDADKMRAWYPVNPVTGLACDDLANFTNPLLSEGEREAIIQRLGVEKGTYLPKGMSDEEIFAIIPPRYFSDDPVNADAWRDYINREILQASSDDGEQQLDTSANADAGNDDIIS